MIIPLSNVCIAAALLIAAPAETTLPMERSISFWTDGANTISQTQVWDIAADTDDDDRVFFASNDGLCIYNGYGWEYLTSQGNPIIRALKFDRGTGRLYSSGVNGFGYWLPDGYGSYSYTSLYTNTEFRSYSLDFWRIAFYGHKVLFQSQKQILVYDLRTERIDTIPAQKSFRFIYDVDGRVWGQDGDSVFRFNSDLNRDPVCSVSGRVVNILPHSGGFTLAVEREGLFLLDEEAGVKPLDQATNKILSDGKITCCKRTASGKYLVGTTQAGLFVINEEGVIERNIQLGHNTILCLAADQSGNVWTGFNNGAAFIDNSSSDRYLFDDRLGQVHWVTSFDDDNLLIGTNKGVFAYNIPDRTMAAEQLPGPAWGFRKINGMVYVLHDQGIFCFDRIDKTKTIFSGKGIYSLQPVPGRNDFFIAGSYSGLSLFSLDRNGDLQFISDINGYQGFCRNIAIDEMSRVWVTVSGDGFVCITLSHDFLNVKEKKALRTDGASDQVFSTQVDDELVLVSGQKAYLPARDSAALVHEPALDSLVILCGNKTRSIVQSGNRFWYVGGSGAGFVERSGSSLTVTTGILDKVYASRSGSGFSLIKSSAVLGFRNGIGICTGEPQKLNHLHYLGAMAIGAEGSLRYRLSDPVFDVPANMNTIQITLAGLSADRRLEYRVSSLSDKWTSVNIGDNLQINSLPSGFHVIEMRVPGNSQLCRLKAHVRRPWYLSAAAFAVYLLIVTGIILLSIYIVQRNNRRKQEALQKELEYLQMKNQLLEKERKLATHALLGVPADEDLEHYFNEIYNGFTDRLKRAHPVLSKTDLKFCIFIKMGLSTKEIAERMNISLKGVEVGKYRLRKKLQLAPGETLPGFIAAFEDNS